MLNRRDLMVYIGASIPASAFAQDLDWSKVVEDQQGDDVLPLETIAFDAQQVQRLMAGRASYRPRLSSFPQKCLAAATSMVGWSRATTPEKVASILDVYGLPFRDGNGKFVPFCAAGISYAVATAYLTDEQKPTTIAEYKNILQEIDHYHFYPSPSVWDMYYVARGKRRWLDAHPGTVIPKPGWLVIYDWKKKGGADHVGIVQSATGSVLTTIEFNTSQDNNSNGGRVSIRHRAYNGTVKGFIRTDLSTPI